MRAVRSSHGGEGLSGGLAFSSSKTNCSGDDGGGDGGGGGDANSPCLWRNFEDGAAEKEREELSLLRSTYGNY